MPRTISLPIFGLLVLFAGAAFADEPLKYRTDENQDVTLPWYQPVPGQFPPADAAHYIPGELISVDHLERVIKLRVDRNDSQTRDMFDHPVTADMLPYGSVYYLGQPAALQDVPLGTHMHGWFFERPEGEQKHWKLSRGRLENVFKRRESPEIDFTRCLRLEDDFSYYTRRNQIWKIDSVNLEKMKLTVTLEENGKPVGNSKEFDLQSSTIIYQGRGFGALTDIAPGQHILMSICWATIYGPGRVSTIWLDEESRRLASAQQLERHHNFMRDRGVPGWVDAVDDEKQIVAISFFDGIDLSLFKDFNIIVPAPLGWPTSGGAKDDLAPKGTIAVAQGNLLMYDPVNDRKGGNIVKTSLVPVVPGCSGVQIQVQCDMLLEGYRPTKIVRFYPASWSVVAMPREESNSGKE